MSNNLKVGSCEFAADIVPGFTVLTCHGELVASTYVRGDEGLAVFN